MSRYGKIENGLVTNAAVADGAWAAAAPGTWVALPTGVGIGWRYDDASFTAPGASERAATIVLTRAAFFQALEAALDLSTADLLPEDHLIAAINAASALSAAQKRQAIMLTRYAREFHRNDPDAPGLMDAVAGAALGLTSADVDQMFLAGAEV